jgi:hypothetical protein
MRQEFTHTDRIFLRAVELGCVPVRGSSVLFPMWMCTCVGFPHAAHDTTIITRESLEAAKAGVK